MKSEIPGLILWCLLVAALVIAVLKVNELAVLKAQAVSMGYAEYKPNDDGKITFTWREWPRVLDIIRKPEGRE